MSTHINARPSDLPNLGAEVLGAHRHRFTTYDEQQEKKERSRKDKAIKSELEKVQEKYLSMFDLCPGKTRENLGKFLYEYFCIQNEITLQDPTHESIRTQVLARRSESLLVTRYNRMLSRRRDIWRADDTLEKYQEFIRPAKRETSTYREENGKFNAWKSGDSPLAASLIGMITENTRALQFGNSVTDNERAYVIENLAAGIHWLSCIVNVDLKGIAFSFGARGRANSVAFYQHSSKLISVNRHNNGSIVHEIGHAIDYRLRSSGVFESIPYTVRDAYRMKIAQLPYNYRKYLMKDTEIFARLFEVYVKSKQHEANEFMLYISDDAPSTPTLCPIAKEYMDKMIAKLYEVQNAGL